MSVNNVDKKISSFKSPDNKIDQNLSSPKKLKAEKEATVEDVLEILDPIMRMKKISYICKNVKYLNGIDKLLVSFPGIIQVIIQEIVKMYDSISSQNTLKKSMNVHYQNIISILIFLFKNKEIRNTLLDLKITDYIVPLLMNIDYKNNEGLSILIFFIFLVIINDADDKTLLTVYDFGIIAFSIKALENVTAKNYEVLLSILSKLLQNHYILNDFCNDTQLLSYLLKFMGHSLSNLDLINQEKAKIINYILKLFSIIVRDPKGKANINKKMPKILFDDKFLAQLDEKSISYIKIFYTEYLNNKKIINLIRKTNIFKELDNNNLLKEQFNNSKMEVVSNLSEDSKFLHIDKSTLLKDVDKEKDKSKFANIESINYIDPFKKISLLEKLKINEDFVKKDNSSTKTKNYSDSLIDMINNSNSIKNLTNNTDNFKDKENIEETSIIKKESIIEKSEDVSKTPVNGEKNLVKYNILACDISQVNKTMDLESSLLFAEKGYVTANLTEKKVKYFLILEFSF